MMDISKYRDNIELSDVCIVVCDHEYNLHKFPLSINSEYLKNQCKNLNKIVLNKFPGGWKTFEYIADHCYGKEVDLNEENVVLILCGAKFLGMNGKYNLLEKCQKFIDRIFRSVEYSKSIETLFPILETTSKTMENDDAKSINEKCLSIIIDLWLRHKLNYKSNLKEIYFEDCLVFGEILKLNLDFIEKIIELCATDENKHRYLAKLAVEYIKINAIDKLEGNKVAENQNGIKIDDLERNLHGKTASLSSSCSSIVELATTDKSWSSCEKESEKAEKNEEKAKKSREIVGKSREAIGELFDRVILALPNNVTLGKVVSVYWLERSLEICERFKCNSRDKLLKLCGGMLTEVPLEDIKNMDQRNVTEMIEEILKDERVDKELMKWIWDNSFLEMAKNDELNPVIFSKVVKNMPESQDIDPDVVFQIVLSILEKVGSDKEKYQKDLIDCVKLEEISPVNLEKAMESKLWNTEDICKTAINRLKCNDKDLLTTKIEYEPYITQYNPYSESDKDFSARYSYNGKNLSSWKSHSFTSHLNSSPYGDEEEYAFKSYEPINSYYPSYRHLYSAYSPNGYLTLEDNLKCELKKISDSYISYYKERFPLRSRRRYKCPISYEF